MKIRFTADSTCDMSAAFIERYQVEVIPLTIELDGKYYTDGVDLTPDEIITHVNNGSNLPKTSAINAAEYREVFTRVLKDCDAVIHFNISSDFSSCWQNACMAAEGLNVWCIDSRNLSSGIALLIAEAADRAEAGMEVAAIAEELKAVAEKLDVSFIVDRLDYLYKGGRCSGLASFFATALKIKPSLLLKEGKIVVGKKYRGTGEKIATQYVDNIFEMYPNPDFKRIFITYTEGTPREVIDKIKNRVNEVHKFENVYETTASSTITCHCGPGTIGILFINDGGER